MPALWKNQQAWQREQEHNLLYVALTRAKQKLFIMGNPDCCGNLDGIEVSKPRKFDRKLSTLAR